MPIGIGIGISPSLRGLKGSLAPSGALTLLGAETDGFAVDWTDDSSILKRAGSIVIQGSANSQLVVFGTLISSPTGATFNASNGAYLEMSGFSDLATYRLTNTIYAEASVDTIDATVKVSVGFADSVAGNASALRQLTAINGVAGIVTSASASVVNIVPTATPVANTYYKLALSSQLDNYDAAWSGVAGPHDALGAMPINPVRCYFGFLIGGSVLNGKMKRAMILPRKMALVELQTRTT